MTESQMKFEVMLEQYPDIACYWDFETMKAKIKTSEGLPLSRGELIMVDFFLSVWFGRNVNFDIIRAAGYLSNDNKRIITNWFMDPFWP